MKISRNVIENCLKVLIKIPVKNAKEKRKFAAFQRLLNSDLEQFHKDLSEIQKQYIPKDENGEFILEDLGDGKTSFEIPEESRGRYYSDINDLLSEFFVWERTESNSDTYDTVKSIIENYDGELSGGELQIYDILCSSFGIEDVILV